MLTAGDGRTNLRLCAANPLFANEPNQNLLCPNHVTNTGLFRKVYILRILGTTLVKRGVQ